MTISTIMACVFGWLFVNTWLSILVVKLAGEFFSSWEDYGWLFTMAVVSPLPFLLVRWFFQLKKKIKTAKES